jgi:hypothetical protein
MTYTDTERLRATAWKHSTTTIPAEAKLPAPYFGKAGRVSGSEYDYALPSEAERAPG